MDDKERAESKLPKIHEIPLSEIDEFPNHPFHVRLDEDMDQLVESIKERGIITPVTLRQKPDGRYEIVSGHRRTKACELAGLATVKAEIKELSRDEAIILMVESNLQRTTILPSEKAYSYKMRLEAMKRQGGFGGRWENRFPARRGTFLPDRGGTKRLAGFHQFRAVHPILGSGPEDERIFPERQAQRRCDPLHHVRAKTQPERENQLPVGTAKALYPQKLYRQADGGLCDQSPGVLPPVSAPTKGA